jgi:hypothetical protein
MTEANKTTAVSAFHLQLTTVFFALTTSHALIACLINTF